MMRKRERFERTDVPVPSARRNLVGAIVAVASLVVTAVIVLLVWNHVSSSSSLGDVSLSDAVEQQAAASPAEGYVATEGTTCTLFLTADSLDEQGATLASARVLATNPSQGTAALVSLPVDLALTVDGGATTLSELFSSQGAAACVAPLASAAGVSFSGVVVSTDDVLEEAAALAGTSADDLVGSASELLSRIRTNLDAAGLLSLAESLSSVGVSNLAASDAPLVAETTTDEEGNVTETGRQVLDTTQLGVALGTIAPAA